jgi:hypothetical protein
MKSRGERSLKQNMTDGNNYKRILTLEKMEKRGQVAVFVIIAIVIVAAILLIYLFYPRIESLVGAEDSPNEYLMKCIEPSITDGVETLSKQGGYMNPEGYVLYQSEKIKYLCYTAQYYVPCYVQQPLLRAHFENELKTLIDSQTKTCVDELKSYYGDRGYVVTGGDSPSADVAVNFKSIDVDVKLDMTIEKDSSRRFESIEFGYPSEMYALLMTATSIIDFESTYGDSETLDYVKYYPNLKIEKIKLGDGSTVYNLGDVRTGESFTFASRSLAWPGGLGLTA